MDTAQIKQFLRGTDTMRTAFHNRTNNFIYECNDGSGYCCGIEKGSGVRGGYGHGSSEGRGSRDGKSCDIDEIYIGRSGDKNGGWFGDGDAGSGDSYGRGIDGKYPRGVCNVNNTALTILIYNGKPVYTVDGIPCVFQSIHDTLAKVAVISKTDFTSQTAFIAQFNGFFAHGETVRDALLSAKEKYYRNIDFEAKKAELKALFSRSADKKLSVRTLYEWHGMLTGSCCFGRDEFIRTHTFKYDDRLTLKEFVNLTAAHFGGEKIKELLE